MMLAAWARIDGPTACASFYHSEHDVVSERWAEARSFLLLGGGGRNMTAEKWDCPFLLCRLLCADLDPRGRNQNNGKKRPHDDDGMLGLIARSRGRVLC